MEFKFRAVDGKPPTLFSSSSTLGYFSEEAFRANYPNIDPRQNPELMRNQTLQCEIEKQRIREEIIAKEIARRRVLEAEVRRELMMEREMAMRVGIRDGGLSSEERLTMRLEQGAWFPCVNQFDNRRLEDRSAFHGHGVFDQWPRLSEALVLPDVKPVSEDNKDKLIVLAKPNSNLCGAKRKAATPPEQGAVGLPDAGLKKIPKEEWNCTLCNVSATSERGLNEHLQGKRHKAKEARLRANRVAKNLSPIPFPKKTAKPANLTTSIAGSELEAKVEGELLEVEKANDDTDKKRENKQDSGNANDKLQKCTYRKFEEKRGREIAEERTAEFRKKKQFKFWCEMCQIGAYSAVVMEAHEKGKKHKFQLQQLHQNGEAVPAITTMVSSKAGEKAKDREAVTVEANEKKTGNANYKEKTTETVAGNDKIIENGPQMMRDQDNLQFQVNKQN